MEQLFIRKINQYFQITVYLTKKDIFQQKKIDFTFFSFKKRKIKFLICEEMWSKEFIKLNKSIKPDLLIAINASPFEIDKFSQRTKIAKERC